MNRPGHPYSDGQPEPLTGPQTPSGMSSANAGRAQFGRPVSAPEDRTYTWSCGECRDGDEELTFAECEQQADAHNTAEHDGDAWFDIRPDSVSS